MIIMIMIMIMAITAAAAGMGMIFTIIPQQLHRIIMQILTILFQGQILLIIVLSLVFQTTFTPVLVITVTAIAILTVIYGLSYKKSTM